MTIDEHAMPGSEESPRGAISPEQTQSLIRDWWAGIRDAYQKYIAKHRVDRFWTPLGYASGTAVRLLTFESLLRGGKAHFEICGVHIHHMVPGLGMVLAAGIFHQDRRADWRIAWLFGAGAGLMLDESSLMVFVADDYWTERGLLVTDASEIAMGAALVINLLVGWHFYGEAAHQTRTLAIQAVRSLRG